MRRRAAILKPFFLAALSIPMACRHPTAPIPPEPEARRPRPSISGPHVTPMDALRERILGVIEGRPGIYAVAFKDLESGETLYINERDRMHAASLMKVPVLMALFDAIDRGEARLFDRVTIETEFESIHDGSTYRLPPARDSPLRRRVGQSATLDELATATIVRSDNLATNLLIDIVTAPRVMGLMERMGAFNTRVLRGVEDGPAFEAGLNNEIDARDMMELLVACRESHQFSRESRARMMEILRRQEILSMIYRGVPRESGAVLAHKMGRISTVEHDAALVELPGGRSYALAILARDFGADRAAAREAGRAISTLVYEYVSGETVDAPLDAAEAWRRIEAGADRPMAFEAGWSADDRPIRAHYFPGRSERRALVVAGVHGSELSGIEVAERLVDSLKRGERPYFTTLVLPALFADNAALARLQQPYPPVGLDSSVGRTGDAEDCVKRPNGDCIDPNRNFPPPGEPMNPVDPRDALGSPIEPENRLFLNAIDRFRPERIASIHAKSWTAGERRRFRRGSAAPGIFADPHTRADGEDAVDREKSNADAELALAMARFAAARGARLPGNWLDSAEPVAEYGIPSDRFTGVSLGRWAPRAIESGGSSDRPSIGVITVEIQHYHPLSAEPDEAETVFRARELQAHCDSLREVFLEDPLAPRAP
jgi:beta-lactamase class A